MVAKEKTIIDKSSNFIVIEKIINNKVTTSILGMKDRASFKTINIAMSKASMTIDLTLFILA